MAITMRAALGRIIDHPVVAGGACSTFGIEAFFAGACSERDYTAFCHAGATSLAAFLILTIFIIRRSIV